MALRCAQGPPLPIMLWASVGELSQQMLPFVCELPFRDRNPLHRAYLPDLAAVKGIATTHRLGVDGAQVGRNGAPRSSVG